MNLIELAVFDPPKVQKIQFTLKISMIMSNGNPLRFLAQYPLYGFY